MAAVGQTSFRDIPGIHQDTLQVLRDLGFERATPVQVFARAPVVKEEGGGSRALLVLKTGHFYIKHPVFIHVRNLLRSRYIIICMRSE
jgi:hypothetical protein